MSSAQLTNRLALLTSNGQTPSNIPRHSKKDGSPARRAWLICNVRQKMGISSESTARAVIQRLRPNAQKHGLRRAIIDAYLREHLPSKYRGATWDQMKAAPDYEQIRKDAEYRGPPFIPDLSEVYPAEREIVVYEIQDRCPVSRAKMWAIRHWVGRLDGWDSWALVLITTNGMGFGWDILIDTLTEGRRYALNSGLYSDQEIESRFRWRNWRMPKASEFDRLKQSMSFV